MGTPRRAARSPCVIFFGVRNSSRRISPGEVGRRFFGIMCSSLPYSIRKRPSQFADAPNQRSAIWHLLNRILFSQRFLLLPLVSPTGFENASLPAFCSDSSGRD